MKKRFDREQHAAVYGTAGERPRLAGLLRASWPLLLAVAAAGYLLRALFPQPRLTMTVVGMLLLALGVVVAVALTVIHTRLTAFVKGARGEERVARALVFLPAEYTVFHGVALPPARGVWPVVECDHVVVGPTGVFAIETKSWRGDITLEGDSMLYNGKEPTRSPLEQVKRSADCLRAHLGKRLGTAPEIQPLVCLAGDNLRGDRQGASGIVACNARCLTQVIADSGAAPLPEADALSIASCLKKLID